ncbi:MAG: LysE family transporter [Candidatus Bathyarchaeia archaeon]
MDLTQLMITTVAVSISGAFSPGPLTTSAITLGARRIANSGLLVALGHMMFELPYVLFIALFLAQIDNIFLNSMYMTYALTTLISFFIVFFAYTTLKDGWRIIKTHQLKMSKKWAFTSNPIIVGILLTALNPYFLLWWVSAGLPLIRVSISMGFTYLLLMYTAHVWLDYLWLAIMGFAGEKSAEILKSKGYGLLLMCLGLLLAIFAVDLSLRTFIGLSLLPF